MKKGSGSQRRKREVYGFEFSIKECLVTEAQPNELHVKCGFTHFTLLCTERLDQRRRGGRENKGSTYGGGEEDREVCGVDK